MFKEEALSVAGAAGNIEVRLAQAKSESGETAQNGAEVGFIMCHPHPLKGGTMDNKVVTTMVRTANKAGIPSLRFNFRGVGASEGEHTDGIGEQDDLALLVDYAREELGWKKIILGGFSFGCGVACLYSLRQPEICQGLFFVAPAVYLFDAPTNLPFEFESHVYMGDADEVVPFEEVEHWVDTVTPQPHWRVFEDAGHFFHGRLTDLKASFLEDLTPLL